MKLIVFEGVVSGPRAAVEIDLAAFMPTSKTALASLLRVMSQTVWGQVTGMGGPHATTWSLLVEVYNDDTGLHSMTYLEAVRRQAVGDMVPTVSPVTRYASNGEVTDGA